MDNNGISKQKLKEEDDADSMPLSKIDIIKKFDNKYRDEFEKMAKLKDERPEAAETPVEKEVFEEVQTSDKELPSPVPQNQVKNGHTTPPKPLPRTSRNNSVSEQGNGVVATEELVDKIPRPVARPRTTASYKVRPDARLLYIVFVWVIFMVSSIMVFLACCTFCLVFLILFLFSFRFDLIFFRL